MPVKIWRKPLDTEKIKVPEGEVHIIKSRCKGCGYCIEFCPKEMLETSEEMNEKGVYPPKVKDDSKCALCGFCESVCPDFAIYSVKKECKDGC
jgi:2-oxoglutarate ferredoxin oxidoreductase subunit delta